MPDDADEHVHHFPIMLDRRMRPEQALAIAVLLDAVRMLQRHAVTDDRTARMRVAEVEAWFACDDADHLFTFVAICEALALDVAYVRTGLRQWRESHQVAIRTEPRVLGLTGRRRPEERVAASCPPAAPGTLTSPTGGGGR